ncbi:MAG: DUF269 domain-containing protein [Cyanobacteria bacterium P01_E01_bin.42]
MTSSAVLNPTSSVGFMRPICNSAPITPPERVRETIYDRPFLQELARQVRLRDTSGIYRDWSNELMLQSLIATSDREYEAIAGGEIDTLSQLRISAFYHAIAATIEKEIGEMTETFLNLHHCDSNSALIFCGRVLVVLDLFKRIVDFGFDSLERLVAEGERLIVNATHKASRYLL